jgi:hypothetical protein
MPRQVGPSTELKVIITLSSQPNGCTQRPEWGRWEKKMHSHSINPHASIKKDHLKWLMVRDETEVKFSKGCVIELMHKDHPSPFNLPKSLQIPP